MKVTLLLIIIGGSSFSWLPQIVATGANSSFPDPWTTLNHDPAHSGFVSGSAPHLPRILWTFATGDYIWATPLIANGTVFVQSGDKYLYAVNQSTGAMIWRTKIGIGGLSTPTIYGDSIYAAANNSLYRINALTGQEIWNITIGPNIDLPPDLSLLAVSGRIYAPESEVFSSGRLNSVDAMNGTIIWNSTGGYGDPAYANGLVFTGHGRNVEAHNATNGKLVWNYTVVSAAVGFTVSNGVLYGEGIDLYALNATTGHLIWRSGYPGGGWVAAVAYNKIFLNPGPGVTAVDQATGKGLWVFSFKNQGLSYSNPAVADGLVFAGGGATIIPDPTLYALNATSGKLVWSYPVKIGANSSPAISNGTIYFGDDNGILYAIGNQLPMPPSNQLEYVLILFTVLSIGLALAVVVLRSSRSRTIKSGIASP